VTKQAIAKCKIFGKNAWLSHINILLEMLNIQALQETHAKRKRKNTYQTYKSMLLLGTSFWEQNRSV
jgi:hypothetical protein